MNRAIKKQIFVSFIILFVLLAIYFALDLFTALPEYVKWVILIVGIIIFFMVLMAKTGFILFLQEFQRAVIFRFGRLNRVAGPGWALMIPGIEIYNMVDLRVMAIDVPQQEVLTKDNVALKIDAVIYLAVKKDPKSIINSIVAVEDYKKAAQLFIKSSVREVIGNMVLSDVVSNINQMNSNLKKELERISESWGLDIQSVELKEIIVPDIVVKAMHEQKAAVQEKLATIQRAEAEKEKIAAINQSASELSDKSISYYYIKALEEMSRGSSTKIIFPMEFSRLAEILAGKVAPKANEKSKVENFIDKYGDLIEENIDKVEKKAKKK